MKQVSKAELFLGFLKIGLLGFGGVGPWVRHVIVEERRWLTDQEFAEILGAGQVLPGPNTTNAAVFIGDRFQGVPGVLACLLGMMAMPLVIVTSLAAIYDRVASVPEVNAGLTGAAAAAAGLVLGTALKMIRNIRPDPVAWLVIALGFAAVAVFGWPLVPVVVVLVPVAIVLAMLRRPAVMGGMTGVLAELARTFAALSLVSIGGINVLLPEIRRQVVDVHGWMTDAAFAHTFAIASAAPGPNVIVVSLILGWEVAGLPGLLVATIAIMTSSCLLAFLVARALGRWSGSKVVAILRDALVPVGLGLMLASGLAMMRSVDRDLVTVAISLGTAAFVVFSRRNPLWALGAGTVVNIITLHI